MHIVVGSLFAAIIGSMSFWGSLVAFGKLQEILPGRPIGLGKAQQAVNVLLLLGAVAAAVASAWRSGGAEPWWMVGCWSLAGGARRDGRAARSAAPTCPW